ncbi:putative histone deacetylase-like protein [Scheffersomyces xylosifermentans]|uniref:putative histone deacetylase-like protein n=1 Tax=Scheffersomyces xylosifermentans TaxID=1304137 RepID=UPI00315D88CB
MSSAEFDESLKPLVEAIKKGKKVTFFNGAGVSTSAGIPDFRSPKTGLYSNLAKLDLPYAEAVFDLDYFRKSPKAFYTLTHELLPGKFAPTKFHYLVRLFQDKKLLHRVYTQNIDTLERMAGVEDKYIIEAHGSFAKNHCIDCSEEMSSETLLQHMLNKEKNNGIPTCEKCNGYVKPDIVFFGEGLPPKFFDTWDEDADEVEVAIVAGTSLTVYPFASLPSEVGKNALRVLINKEKVGDFKSGKRRSDIVILSDCDSIAERLSELLGWKEELDAFVESAKKHFKANDETAAERAEEITEEIKESLDEDKETKARSEKQDKQETEVDAGAVKKEDAKDKELESLEEDIKKLNI